MNNSKSDRISLTPVKITVPGVGIDTKMKLEIEDYDGNSIYRGEMSLEQFAKMITGECNMIIHRDEE